MTRKAETAGRSASSLRAIPKDSAAWPARPGSGKGAAEAGRRWKDDAGARSQQLSHQEADSSSPAPGNDNGFASSHDANHLQTTAAALDTNSAGSSAE